MTNAGDKALMQHDNLGSMKQKAWECTPGMANVTSEADLANQCHMKFDNAVKDAFTL